MSKLAAVVFCCLGVFAECIPAQAEQVYTAQRRPRVTVMRFNDTNTSADEAQYGPSVSAMLVTFFKRQSQLVVVERQNLKHVLDEWEMNRDGKTQVALTEEEASLLERIDVIIQGNVTVLGNRIEVDGKILSRQDGRIIAAAQRGGPIGCLRKIVNRLGTSLEYSFLRPFYGEVQLTLYEPENTEFLLTPVLTNLALDEEKPPTELSSTVVPGGEEESQDQVSAWIANPATYTIENILAGWYTLRLKRSGYDGLSIDNDSLRAVAMSGGFRVYYRKGPRLVALSSVPQGAVLKKFLIKVDPRETHAFDLTALGLEMYKKQGALEFEVTDKDGRPIPNARILMKSAALELDPEYPTALREALEAEKNPEVVLNRDQEAAPEVAKNPTPKVEKVQADESMQLERGMFLELLRLAGNASATPEPEEPVCDFRYENPPHYFDYGEKIIYEGEAFDFDRFKGDEISFERYRGEAIPTGLYHTVVWAPSYQAKTLTVLISDDREGSKNRKIELERQRRDVMVLGRSDNQIRFQGSETGFDRKFSLADEKGVKTITLPVDSYAMESSIGGLSPWSRSIDLAQANENPPTLERAFSDEEDRLQMIFSAPPEIRIKNSLWVGGRYQEFRPYPNTFYNPRVGELLDELLNLSSVFDWSNLEAEDDKLRRLADQLQDIDLLILNDDDMSRIRVFPELAAIIRSYVGEGRSLMAFISRGGQYGNVLGRPLTLKKRFFGTDKMRLVSGEVGNMGFDYDIDLGQGRSLLKIKTRKLDGRHWRVLSYTKKKKKPRVIETGDLQNGGYVMIWFESTQTKADWERFFKGKLEKLTGEVVAAAAADSAGGIKQNLEGEDPLSKLPIKEVLKIAEAKLGARQANDQIALVRSQLKGRALLWAEYLMSRRLNADQGTIDALRNRIRSRGTIFRASLEPSRSAVAAVPPVVRPAGARTAGTRTVRQAAAECQHSRPAAAVEETTAQNPVAAPKVPFDRVLDISWSPQPSGIKVEIKTNGLISRDRYRHFRMDGENPREVLLLRGVGQGYPRHEIGLESGLIEKIRVGYHDNQHLHVVFDLLDGGAKVARTWVEGETLALLFERSRPQVASSAETRSRSR